MIFFLAYFACSLCNIFAYGHAYAYKTYEFIGNWLITSVSVTIGKLFYFQGAW